MPKIVEYRLLTSANSTKDLQDDVNDHISRGWQPLGGGSVAIHIDDSTEEDAVALMFAQAVVKYE